MVPLLDGDAHDDALRAQLRPGNRANPVPAPRYKLVVVGGGPAGLVAAIGAAALGAKVAIVERDLLGGDCLNVGCVPSKALLKAAHAAADVRAAASLGIHAEPHINFPAIMARLRRVRSELAANDSIERLTQLGIDVFLGEASFANDAALDVAGVRLNFRRCIVATGSRAKVPPGIGCETNETIFARTELPRRLLVLGGGPIGCELGQAFARLGSAVTLQVRGRVLPREIEAASHAVEASLRADGVAFVPEADPAAFDVVLAAIGRMPNVESLNLPAAGIAFDARGILVNDHLRTTNANVYAAGDVSSFGEHFTHAADALARIAVQNALFPLKARASALVIPHCTYTAPEVASVGEQDVPGASVYEHGPLDRAATDGVTLAVRLVTRGDRILGATIVGPHAGELINTVSLAMRNGLGLKALGRTVFAYPTLAESLKKIADASSRRRLTPTVARALRWWVST